jgi:hypothetical protein
MEEDGTFSKYILEYIPYVYDSIPLRIHKNGLEKWSNDLKNMTHLYATKGNRVCYHGRLYNQIDDELHHKYNLNLPKPIHSLKYNGELLENPTIIDHDENIRHDLLSVSFDIFDEKLGESSMYRFLTCRGTANQSSIYDRYKIEMAHINPIINEPMTFILDEARTVLEIYIIPSKLFNNIGFECCAYGKKSTETEVKQARLMRTDVQKYLCEKHYFTKIDGKYYIKVQIIKFEQNKIVINEEKLYEL